VGRDGCSDGYGVERLVRQHLLEVGRAWNSGVAPRLRIQRLRPDIAEKSKLEGRRLREIAHKVGAPVAQTDDADAQGPGLVPGP
jgi:hypothetical protein